MSFLKQPLVLVLEQEEEELNDNDVPGLSSVTAATTNAVVTYHAYLVNGTVLTRAAYLIVKGPPTTPTDVNSTAYNDTTGLGTTTVAQSPSLLSYAVVIRNGSGAPVYTSIAK
eukprot:Em0012g19a